MRRLERTPKGLLVEDPLGRFVTFDDADDLRRKLSDDITRLTTSLDWALGRIEEFDEIPGDDEPINRERYVVARKLTGAVLPDESEV